MRISKTRPQENAKKRPTRTPNQKHKNATAYNHVSTIAEAADGALVVAWFGGSLEGADDVSIWMSRNSGSGWSPIAQIDDGRRPDGNDYSCWNPVLIAARNGTLYLSTRSAPSARR